MKKSHIGAYETNIKRVETPAETDAAVLEQAALVLESVKVDPESETFHEALIYNQRIWTVLQVFLETADMISDDIRGNLMSLSIFVDKQTFKAMAERNPKLLDSLININRQIAAGFRGIPVERPLDDQQSQNQDEPSATTITDA